MQDELLNCGIKKDDGYLFKIKVVANSKKNSIEIIDGDTPIKLKISKPAVDGKANEEIIKFLSETFKTAKKNITILKGEKSSIKSVFLKKN